MRKKFLTYLFIYTFIAVVSFGAAIFYFVDRITGDLISMAQDHVQMHVEEKFQDFDKHMKFLEPEIHKVCEIAILEISEQLADFDLQKNITPSELKIIAEANGVDEIYIINRNGIVFNSSFVPDLELDFANSHNSQFADFLKSLFDHNQIKIPHTGISVKTGEVNTYAYYCPEGSDSIIEISVDIRKFVDREFPDKIAGYFSDIFSQFFVDNQSHKAANGKCTRNHYLKSFDIIDITKISQWSMLVEGRKVNLSKEMLSKLNEERSLFLRDGPIIRVLQEIPIPKTATFEMQTTYIDCSYDFSQLFRIKNTVIFHALTFFVVIAIVVYIFFARYYQVNVVDRVNQINRGIGEIHEGDYDSKIDVASNDELDTISQNINQLAHALKFSLDELHETQQKLLSSEKKYKELYYHSPIAFYRTDFADGKLLECNDAFVALFGYERRDECFAQESVEEYWVDIEKRQELLGLVEREGVVERFETKLRKKNGELFWGSIWAKRSLVDGCIEGGVFDRSHRKEAEAKVREYQDKLRHLASDLTLTEQRHKRDIATDIHDNISQALAFGYLRINSIKESICADCKEDLQGYAESLKELIDYVRDMTFDLSSPALYQLGLEVAVEDLLEHQFTEDSGVEHTFSNDCKAKLLEKDVSIILYQSVKELFVNIAKHAYASKVEVNFSRVNDSIQIVVKDNGVGFDPGNVQVATREYGRFGLFNIGERLDYIDGCFAIESEFGKGCVFTLIAPLAASDNT